MLTCPNPSCNKPLPALSRMCSYCQADLSLLVDYVDQLDDALARAEEWTRAGALGKAVWAYLEVLEVDPDNVRARAQVGQVATAVRVFDQVAQGRRWQNRLRSRESAGEDKGRMPGWLKAALLVLLVVAAFLLGYRWGME
jgi:hypothetical protein